ncbi:MAG TPA: hypothetical protein VNA30_04055 [Mycobacteriales bacterium]|nr:hypothetical protein [Mycobacteriales bacterium]
MEHVVFFPASDGTPAFRRVGALEEAVALVEHLRNMEGVAEVSVHALNEVPLNFRPYYRVEVPPAGPAHAPADAAPVLDVRAVEVPGLPAAPEPEQAFAPAEAQPEPTYEQEAQPEAQPEAPSEPQGEPSYEAPAEAVAQPEAQAEPAVQPEAQAEAPAQPEAQAEAPAQPEPVAEAVPASIPAVEARPERSFSPPSPPSPAEPEPAAAAAAEPEPSRIPDSAKSLGFFA